MTGSVGTCFGCGSDVTDGRFVVLTGDDRHPWRLYHDGCDPAIPDEVYDDMDRQKDAEARVDLEDAADVMLDELLARVEAKRRHPTAAKKERA